MGSSLFVVGFHGAHSDALADSLSDVAALVKRKPRRAKLAIMADWNIDLLPSLSADPFQSKPSREEFHRGRRSTLQTFCDSLRVHIVVPHRVASSPGGPFGELALSVPFTRVPVGDNCEHHLPSLLDYFAVSDENMLEDSVIDWLPISDHALVSGVARCPHRVFQPQRGKWHCRSWEETRLWMRDNSCIVSEFRNASSFFAGRRGALLD